jgi:hypothetical protein
VSRSRLNFVVSLFDFLVIDSFFFAKRLLVKGSKPLPFGEGVGGEVNASMVLKNLSGQ